MITHLSIRNVALIDEAEVDFAPGLNVLSGETGAGKSIVVDSINFLLGGRVSRDLIRAGAGFACVEGVVEFDGPFFDFVKEGLLQLGIDGPECEDGQIMLHRRITADNGKSVCRINGRTVTVSVLKNAAQLLVDLHGQHEHQSLLDPAKQLAMLDQFCEIGGYKKNLASLLAQYKEVNRDLKKLAASASSEQIDMWRFQLDEIERAALKPGEEDALMAKQTRLAAGEKLSKNTGDIVALLSAGFFGGSTQLSAADQAAKAVALAAEIAEIDPSQKNQHSSLVDIHAQISEIARDFRNYASDLGSDPVELDKTEARIDTIYRLKKKYGGTLETVLKKQDELHRNIESIENSEAEIARANAKRKELTREISDVCGKMTALRTARAKEISREITVILRELGMQNAEFFMELSKKTTFTPDGNNDLEFMFCPNPGEPPKPLRRIASGGEMSRIMLAIKTILSDRISTVIFDEVDTGISGRTAQQVAEKLLTVSRTRQILCITHLPQIAAMADTHFLIEKTVRPAVRTAHGDNRGHICEGEHSLEAVRTLHGENRGSVCEDGDSIEAGSAEVVRTVTTVTPLSREESINELARLTGGAQITEATLQAATEMKSQAEELK